MKQTKDATGCPFKIDEDRPPEMCSDGLPLANDEARKQAYAFLSEQYPAQAFQARWQAVRHQLQHAGSSYRHTAQELEQAAQQAWRNSSRCIGRLYWPSLNVIDARSVTSEDDVFEVVCQQLRQATNGGKIKSTITIMPQADADIEAPFRILNDQVIRYAGFRHADSWLGDRQQIALTEYARSRGWDASPSAFQILPLFIQKGSTTPRMYLLPQEDTLEVDIRHPDAPQLNGLRLRWHALPMITNMAMHAGGVVYPCAPFNGWYMGAEIGARNLADPQRYNLLPTIAHAMGWDSKRNRSLWRDKALVLLNEAILWSFERDGVKIQDHHTCSQDFQRFVSKEAAAGREVSGDWRWLVPPISGASSPIFHQDFQVTTRDPNFYYLPNVDFRNLN